MTDKEKIEELVDGMWFDDIVIDGSDICAVCEKFGNWKSEQYKT